MPRIESYTFGRMVVEGHEYRTDLILLPRLIIDNWWRKEGHLLQLADLDAILGEPIQVLVVGTGAHGMMRIAEEVHRVVAEKGIKLVALPTAEACTAYNKYWEEHPEAVAAAFHLTC